MPKFAEKRVSVPACVCLRFAMGIKTQNNRIKIAFIHLTYRKKPTNDTGTHI